MRDQAPHDPTPPAVAEAVAEAQREGARPGRSRLEPWTEVVFILRGKRWSFAAITDWLARRGVLVAESTVQRFYRSRDRGTDPTSHQAQPSDPGQPPAFFNPPDEKPQASARATAAQPASKPKYNTNF